MQETQEMWVQSLGHEDPLEEEMATHSSTLAWKFPWTEEAGGLQSMELQRVRHDRVTSLSCIHSWKISSVNSCKRVSVHPDKNLII